MRAKHITALRRAVNDAECWRGALVGHPDPEVLAKFEQNIKTMKEALKAAEAARRLMKEYVELCGLHASIMPTKAWSDRVKKAVDC